MTCSKCNKSDKVIPILYGEPTPEAAEEEKQGLLVLGGCIVNESFPDWYCKRDKLEF